MDRDPLPQIAYQCQVCGHSGKPTFTTGSKDDWVVHKIYFEEDVLVILGCPNCSYFMNLDEIFEAYKARIRSGADLSYH